MPAPGAAPTKKPAKSDRCSAVHVVESVVVRPLCLFVCVSVCLCVCVFVRESV